LIWFDNVCYKLLGALFFFLKLLYVVSCKLFPPRACGAESCWLFYASVAERSIAPDCKSGALRATEVRPVIRPGVQSDDRTNHFIMFYIYFLKLSNGDIYKGFTEDLKRRLEEHNQGRVNSTKNYRPLILIGYEAYKLKSDAIRREKFLKTTEGRRLLKQQLRDILK